MEAKPPVNKFFARAILFQTQGNNKQVRYVLSNEDYLTLLRAVDVEGEPRDGVAWALLQRFAFVYPAYRSLTTFLKAYAQPINPRWFPDGDLHKKELDRLVRGGHLAEAEDENRRAMKRTRYALTPIEKISKPTRDIVDLVFSTKSPVPGAVHYRAPTKVTKTPEEAKEARQQFARTHKLDHTIDYGNVVRDNWFFGQSSSMNARIQTLWAEVSAAGRIALALLVCSSTLNLLYQLSKRFYG